MDCGTYNIRIADFGLAHAQADTHVHDKSHTHTQDGKLHFPTRTPGSPSYMSPQVAEMVPFVGELADLFSIGVILVTLVTGNMAFSRATKTDNLYKCFYYNKAHIYWKSRCKALAT